MMRLRLSPPDNFTPDIWFGQGSAVVVEDCRPTVDQAGQAPASFRGIRLLCTCAFRGIKLSVQELSYNKAVDN
jgi:hypothetical protein